MCLPALLPPCPPAPLPSCPPALLPSCPPALLPSCPPALLPSILFPTLPTLPQLRAGAYSHFQQIHLPLPGLLQSQEGHGVGKPKAPAPHVCWHVAGGFRVRTVSMGTGNSMCRVSPTSRFSRLRTSSGPSGRSSSSSSPSTSQAKVDDAPPHSVSMLWQMPQYFVITTGEILLSTTGLEFSYSQVGAGCVSGQRHSPPSLALSFIRLPPT